MRLVHVITRSLAKLPLYIDVSANVSLLLGFNLTDSRMITLILDKIIILAKIAINLLDNIIELKFYNINKQKKECFKVYGYY